MSYTCTPVDQRSFAGAAVSASNVTAIVPLGAIETAGKNALRLKTLAIVPRVVQLIPSDDTAPRTVPTPFVKSHQTT